MSIDVLALLDALGIEARPVRGKYKASCPNPAHSDSDPSWSITDEGGHYCFGCKLKGGPWELAAAVWGVSVREAGKLLAERGIGGARVPRVPREVTYSFGPGLLRPRLALPREVRFDALQNWPRQFREYLERRHVDGAQVAAWSIGYATSGRLAGRVVVPVYTGGRLATWAARSIDGREPRYSAAYQRDGAAPDAALLGEHLWIPSGVITVAEGPFSVLALDRAGAQNPTGLLGSVITAEKWMQLRTARLLVIATDPDSAGDDAAAELAARCETASVRSVRVTLPTSPDDCTEAELRAALQTWVHSR